MIRTSRSDSPVHLRDQDRRPTAPCDAAYRLPGRLPSSLDPARCQAGCSANAFLVGSSSRVHAPGSPRSRHRVRQHVVGSAPRPAPRRQRTLRAVVGQDARCVGSMNAVSLPRISTRTSSVSGAVGAFASRARRDRLLSRQSHSLRRVVRSPQCSTAAGVVFPSWRVRTEPLTPLSPPPGATVTLARSRPAPEAAETAAGPLAWTRRA